MTMRIRVCPKCGWRWSAVINYNQLEEEKSKPIFSGDYSVDMWKRINEAKTIRDCRDAMYLICCRLQEFEARLTAQKEGVDEQRHHDISKCWSCS